MPIQIADLPQLSDLTPEQLSELFGAGRFGLRLEALEQRLVQAGSVDLTDSGILTIEGGGFENWARVDFRAGQVVVDLFSAEEAGALTSAFANLTPEQLADPIAALADIEENEDEDLFDHRHRVYDLDDVVQIGFLGGADDDYLHVMNYPDETGQLVYRFNAETQTSFPLTFIGGDGDDFLVNASMIPMNASGGAGRDVLFGGWGHIEQLYGGAENDLLVSGGGGNDTLWGQGGDDWLYDDFGWRPAAFEPFNPIRDIVGDTGSPQDIAALDQEYRRWRPGGADLASSEFAETTFIQVPGRSGDANVFYGGAGNDVIIGSPLSDRIYGEEGSDFIFSGAGADVIDADTVGSPNFGNDIVYASGGGDIIRGGGGDDRLYGGADLDYVYGDRGVDKLYGEADTDFLYGGREADYLYGGAGLDTLYGELGDDWLYGGIDNDTLHGGGDADHLYGQDGLDTLYGGTGADWLDGGLDAYRDILYGNTQLSNSDGAVDNFIRYGSWTLNRGTMGWSYTPSHEEEVHGEAGLDLLYGMIASTPLSKYQQYLGNFIVPL